VSSPELDALPGDGWWNAVLPTMRPVIVARVRRRAKSSDGSIEDAVDAALADVYTAGTWRTWPVTSRDEELRKYWTTAAYRSWCGRGAGRGEAGVLPDLPAPEEVPSLTEEELLARIVPDDPVKQRILRLWWSGKEVDLIAEVLGPDGGYSPAAVFHVVLLAYRVATRDCCRGAARRHVDADDPFRDPCRDSRRAISVQLLVEWMAENGLVAEPRDHRGSPWPVADVRRLIAERVVAPLAGRSRQVFWQPPRPFQEIARTMGRTSTGAVAKRWARLLSEYSGWLRPLVLDRDRRPVARRMAGAA
jgi:hypothetical protein